MDQGALPDCGGGMKTLAAPTAAEYQAIFDAERQNEYPVIDAYEDRCGHAIDRYQLETAARVLACPLKHNPPNWQHGRVLYAAARNYLESRGDSIRIVDIGTAKGFSALCLLWALKRSRLNGRVWSVDVIDPYARVRRNTVAEVDGFKTLAETLDQWPEAQQITFSKMTGVECLQLDRFKIHIAFIDGKHSPDVVLTEGRLLHERQETGALAIFDDLQLIGPAVDHLEAEGKYTFERLWIKKDRGYAVGVRRE